MSRAEAHSWWDDVQHLKPGNQPAVTLVENDADTAELVAPPGDDRAGLRDAATESAARRRARITETAKPHLSRAHAADFADAFDLDGAFGAPRRRFARDELQDTGEGIVIVLEREPEPADVIAEPAPLPAEEFVDAVAEEEPILEHELLGEPPARDPETGRRTVRISGHPGATVAPRRLREIQPRRARRSVVDRAVSSPDRMALYAVLLGLFLVVIAAASSGAHP
jgi:hypothetical protein